jgi:hypothetical protein
VISIDVKHSLGGFEAHLAGLADARMKAAVRALNRTMTTVRAEAARAMAREYEGLKIGTLKRQMRFKRATASEAAASITFSNRRFRLYGNWSLRHSRGQRVRTARLPFRVETGEGRRLDPAALRDAFIQRAKSNGAPNLFLRAGRERYPITVLVAPSLSSAFVERQVGEKLARIARTRFAVVFAQELKFRLATRG